jgi:hypothetical protein
MARGTTDKPKEIGKPVEAAKPERKAEFFRGASLMVSDDEVDTSGSFPEITDVKQRLYLEAIAQYPRLGRAARAAGVTPATGWHWRHKETEREFQAAFERAWKMGIERCEGEMWRRGVEGFEKPVYQNGRLVGTVREFSDTAAIFMLKGAKPEVYQERHQHVGVGGGPIRAESVVTHTLDLQRIEGRIRQLTEALRSAPEAEVVEVQVLDVEDDPAMAYAKELARRNGGSGNGDGGIS